MLVPPRREKKGMPKAAWIAIIAGVIIIVIALVIVGVVVTFFVSEIAKPANVANEFMKDIENGNAQAAWNLMSPRGKEGQARSDFLSTIEPAKGMISSYNTSAINVKNSDATVTMNIKFTDDSPGTWYFSLAKQNGKWRIESVRFVK